MANEVTRAIDRDLRVLYVLAFHLRFDSTVQDNLYEMIHANNSHPGLIYILTDLIVTLGRENRRRKAPASLWNFIPRQQAIEGMGNISRGSLKEGSP